MSRQFEVESLVTRALPVPTGHSTIETRSDERRGWCVASCGCAVDVPPGGGVHVDCPACEPTESPAVMSAAPSGQPAARQRRRTLPAPGGISRAIGLRIRRIRRHRRKSLRVVAGLAGMSATTLHRIEHGHRELLLVDLLALAAALDVAPEALIGPEADVQLRAHSGGDQRHRQPEPGR